MSKLTYEEVAEELKRRLYHGSSEPGPDEEGQGRVLTLSFEELSSLSGYQTFSKAFYVYVEWYGFDLGIVIGFGNHGVIVATDDNFAPGGWGPQS